MGRRSRCRPADGERELTPSIIAAVPVKPFGVAKARLAPALDGPARAALGKAVAARTARSAVEAGAHVVVVSADDAVARWAVRSGWEHLAEPPGPGAGLDRAAAAAVARAGGTPWAVIHADLPTVTAGDLRVVFAAAGDHLVLAPSRDGGTNVIAGPGGSFEFHYGAASFRHHAARAALAASAPGGAPLRVVSRPGLALDLDGPDDLLDAMRSSTGRWLRELVPTVVGGVSFPSGSF